MFFLSEQFRRLSRRGKRITVLLVLLVFVLLYNLSTILYYSRNLPSYVTAIHYAKIGQYEAASQAADRVEYDFRDVNYLHELCDAHTKYDAGDIGGSCGASNKIHLYYLLYKERFLRGPYVMKWDLIRGLEEQEQAFYELHKEEFVKWEQEEFERYCAEHPSPPYVPEEKPKKKKKSSYSHVSDKTYTEHYATAEDYYDDYYDDYDDFEDAMIDFDDFDY